MNLMQLPDEQNSKRQVSDENQEKMEKIFLEKPDWKKKEKHHQTVFTNGQFMTLAVVSNLWILGHLFNLQRQESNPKT